MYPSRAKYTHAYTYLHALAHTQGTGCKVHTCLHLPTCTGTHTHTHTHTHKALDVRCTHAYTYLHAPAHTPKALDVKYTHAYTHLHALAHTHTHTQGTVCKVHIYTYVLISNCKCTLYWGHGGSCAWKCLQQTGMAAFK